MPRGSKPGERRGGRQAGTPNKVTVNAREAFARLVEGNVERVQLWLDQVAERDGPRAALHCFLDMAEFHVPKLARTELSGPDGGDIPIKTILNNYVAPAPAVDAPTR